MKVEPEWFNYNFPVVGLEIYRSGWRVCRTSRLKPKEIPRGLRREIMELTKESLSRLAFIIANTNIQFQSIITLTYGETFPRDGQKVKADLHRFLVKFGRAFGEHSYVWFVEFQRRGAPHFHILTSLPGPNRLELVKFAQIWVSACETCSREEREKMFLVHSHRSAWERIREQNGATRYALKYCLKQRQKVVPKDYRNVGRFWGTSRDVKPDLIKRVTITDDELRIALDHLEHPIANWEILPKLIFARD